jgi:hypothetical protein
MIKAVIIIVILNEAERSEESRSCGKTSVPGFMSF